MHSLHGDYLNKIALYDELTSIKRPSISFSMTNAISRHFALKHEISYLNKGAQITLLQDNLNQEYKSDLSLSYIEIMPISLTISVQGIQLYAGPYISSLIQSSIQRMDDEGNYFKDKSLYGDAKQEANYLQKTDFGYMVGLQYHSNLGITVGVRFTEGLAKIFEDAENQESQWDIKNRGFNIQLGYAF